MNRSQALVFTLAVLAVPAAAVALPWFDDMRDQPSVKPQQARVELPDGAIPLDRMEPVPPPRDIAELVRARLRAADLPNPVEADEASLARGAEMYRNHCIACHGREGRGDGPVGLKFKNPPPIDLTYDYIREQPDGRLFYTVTYGGVVMPGYRAALDIEDRWHLVNYVKKVIAER